MKKEDFDKLLAEAESEVQGDLKNEQDMIAMMGDMDKMSDDEVAKLSRAAGIGTTNYDEYTQSALIIEESRRLAMKGNSSKGLKQLQEDGLMDVMPAFQTPRKEYGRGITEIKPRKWTPCCMCGLEFRKIMGYSAETFPFHMVGDQEVGLVRYLCIDCAPYDAVAHEIFLYEKYMNPPDRWPQIYQKRRKRDPKVKK